MNNIKIIEKWLKQTVIGLDLCPFAKDPFKNGTIYFNNCESSDPKEIYSRFIEEVERLHTNQKIETTLLITPNAPLEFEQFNDFIFSLEEILTDNGLNRSFQIVGFHPNFIFNGLDKEDRTNFVNRSPIPLIHILKVSSIDNLDLAETDGKVISLKNEKTLKELSSFDFNKHFQLDV